MATRWDERFFATTRGQVVTLLRQGSRTVDELADALGLTDNAVRAHLAGLERDGLVHQGGSRRSGGKPSFLYELTPEAERLFPKAFGLLLNHLLSVLSDRLPPDTLNDALREVGRRVASGHPVPLGNLRDRVNRAQTLLTNLGGLTEVEEVNGGFEIVGCNCPFSAAVEGSPAACLIAESLLTDLTGVPVRQVCDPGPPPRCRFEIPSPLA
jgi:predicted ArsR family transcriptional regulator